MDCFEVEFFSSKEVNLVKSFEQKLKYARFYSVEKIRWGKVGHSSMISTIFDKVALISAIIFWSGLEEGKRIALLFHSKRFTSSITACKIHSFLFKCFMTLLLTVLKLMKEFFSMIDVLVS